MIDREQAEQIVDGILYDLMGRSGILDGIVDDDVILEMRESLITITMNPPPSPLEDGSGKRLWFVQRALGNLRRKTQGRST